MRFLLDTSILIWWLENPTLLKKDARKHIENKENTIFVSAATQWEISIKKNLGKLDAPENLTEIMQQENFKPLSITFLHAKKAGRLPNHHNDPFDRMLVAQTSLENLTLITRDGHIPKYNISVIEG